VGFSVPTFNLVVNLWRQPRTINLVPDRTFMANLAASRIVQAYAAIDVFFTNVPAPFAGLLCPKLTDIAGMWVAALAGEDCVEVPAGSGRFYMVLTVEDVAKGFPNEYRHALICQLNSETILISGNPWGAPSWPVPTP